MPAPSIAGLVDVLDASAAEREIIPTLEDQVVVVFTDSVPADQFDALADTIDAMENPAAKLRLAAILAEQLMEFLDSDEAAGGFQRIASMINSQTDSNAIA